MSKIDYVSISIECIKHSTDKAVLLELSDGSEQWVPRLNLPDHVNNEIPEGVYMPMESIKVARWFAEKEGIV